MSKTNVVKIILVTLISGGVLFLALRPRPPHALEVGESATNFALPTLSQGSITLRDYRHRVVVLNFWATWCPPCVEETPTLEKFAEQMGRLGVAVIGVSVDRDQAALEKFVSDFHLSFTIARDPDQTLASRYGTFKFPETYIIDRSGKVAEKIIGPTDWQDPRMISFVHELARPGERAGR